jgi:hypothetical protein
MTPCTLREQAKMFRAQADQAASANEALVLSSRAAAYEVHASTLEESSPSGWATDPSASASV